jgi:hypothetical protein
MPNGQQAIVPNEKLLDYLLNEEHEERPGYAVLFRILLGINRSNFEVLKAALLRAAAVEEAIAGKPSPYGQKYEIRFEMTGPRGTYTIVSIWLIEGDSDAPRLITAFVE